MSADLIDVKIPLIETPSGDFASVTGDELIRQRVQLGFATTPGEFHDQDWGAGLQAELNAKQTSSNLDILRRRAERFLATIPGVEEYSATVRAGSNGETLVGAQVRYDGQEVLIPEIKIA